MKTWKKMQENKFGVNYRAVFNRIPAFVDSNKAAELLVETDEFKKASKFWFETLYETNLFNFFFFFIDHIKVHIDRALYAAKLQTILAGKNLYLPGTFDSKALYLKVEVPADATPEKKTEILNIQDFAKHRTEFSKFLYELNMSFFLLTFFFPYCLFRFGK